MSDTLNLAMTITATNLAGGVLRKFRESLDNLGAGAEQVKRDFADMERGLTRGVSAIAGTIYTAFKLAPGVRAAADMQEAMLGVKRNIAGSAEDAEHLAKMLGVVEETAINVAMDAPFSATDVVEIQNNLLKAGLALEDVAGEAGAAFAATALASLSGVAPDEVGAQMAGLGSMFGFKGAQFGEAAEWLSRVDDAAATTLPKLLYGLQMSGSTARAMKVSFQDTVTAMGMLGPLNERAGASLNSFLVRAQRMPEAFEDGQFVGFETFIERLRARMAGMSDDQERLRFLTKAFGDEGSRAANLFLNAAQGFGEIERKAEDTVSMAEKLSIWGEGFNASLSKLKGTANSTLSTLFEPMLAPLTAGLKTLNEWLGKLGEIAGQYKLIGQGVAGLAGAGVAGGLAYGAWQLGKGGFAGVRALKGWSALKTAGGIAAGKAVEAATGVTPVFVTNWPAGMALAGAASTAASVAGTAAGATGKLGRIGATAALAGTAGLAVTGAAVAGYSIGTVINNNIPEGSQTDRELNGIIDALLAPFNKDIRAAREATARADALDRQLQERLQQHSEVDVRLRIDGEGRVVTRDIKSSSRHVNVEVDTGVIMATP